MRTLLARRSTLIGHARSLVGAFLVVLAGVALLQYDRRAPFQYIDTEIAPTRAAEGSTVTVTRKVEWQRPCDGEIYREVVNPNGLVSHYDRGYRPFPATLGTQTATSSFTLPPIMLAPNETQGTATYRGRVRFADCGLSSRLWPIEIPFIEVPFEVVKR